MRACAALGCLLATVLLLASSVGGDEALSCGERGGGIIEGGGGRGERGRARSSTGDGGEEGIWDLTVVESGFTGCDDRDAWTNDTARVQVGSHHDFTVSRERCCREFPSAFFCPAAEAKRVYVLSDYEVSLDSQYRRLGPTIAWLVEPSEICPTCYMHVEDSAGSFDLVFTHDDSLIAKLGSRGRHANWAVPTVHPLPPGETGWDMEQRSLVSFVAARKLMTKGHMMRKLAFEQYEDRLGDVYGNGAIPLHDKSAAVHGYMFHVVIENTRKECYFSEKLSDCFVSGTIPLYWGCVRLGDYFDMGGVLAFDTLDELGVLLDRLSPSLYLEMQGAALQNYRLITEEYKRMSPAHTMWATGVAEFATSLPRVVIFSPVGGKAYAMGDVVSLEWSTRCKFESPQCAEATILLIDGLYAGGMDGGERPASLGVAGEGRLTVGWHEVEVIVEYAGEGEGSAKVRFEVMLAEKRGGQG